MAVESIVGRDVLGLGIALLGAIVMVSPAVIPFSSEFSHTVMYIGEGLLVFGILVASKGRSGQSSN